MILQPISSLYADSYYSARNLNLGQRTAQINSNAETIQNEIIDIVDLSEEAQQFLYENKNL